MFKKLVSIALLTVCCNGIIMDPIFCPEGKQEKIRGTDLKTGTFYKFSMAGPAISHVTWSYTADTYSGHRYIVTDNHSSNKYMYDKGGDRYIRAQWCFHPAKGIPGWYHLTNRAIPGEFAAWNFRKTSHTENYYYLILDPTYSPVNPKPEYLFKPVREGQHYVLKSKSLPNAVIVWYGYEEIGNSHRYYLGIENRDDQKIHYRKGNVFYNKKLINFEAVDTGTKLTASISKIQLLGNFTRDDDLTALQAVEELATKSIFVNNGPSTIAEEYVFKKEISESVFIQRPTNFTKFSTVGVEDAVEIDGNPGIPFLKTPSFNQQLISFYSSASNQTWNYTQTKEFTANQTIEIPRCTEYQVTANVNIATEYPIEYLVHYKLTGEQEGEKMSAVYLREDHFNEEVNNDDDEYIDILDEYTVLAQAKGKMWVTFARDSIVNGKGSQIDGCIGEYVCNQI